MNEIEKAIRAAQAAQRNRIFSTFVTDGASSPDDIVKAEGEDDIQKSVMDSILYDNELKITKTGKEIKQQVDNVILPHLNSILAAKKEVAKEMLAKCGNAPTRDVCSWWVQDFEEDIDLKIYDYEETRYCDHEMDERLDYPTSEEEAHCRIQYNDTVRDICNIKSDINVCAILKNLKDGTSYDLTPRQALSLRFR